jgi:glycosyltransferase involved in cell wall biosynthesis
MPADQDLSRVALIIPALNEAQNLDTLLPILKKLGVGMIMVGDNGSTDGTARVANSHGALVAHEPKRGYGAACYTAMQLIEVTPAADGCDIFAFMGADHSDEPESLPDVVAPVLLDRSDMVIGARVPSLRKPGSMTFAQKNANYLFAKLIRFGWGHRYTDLGPLRAIRRDCLNQIDMQDRAFGWTVEMQIRAVEEGLRIEEVPVPYAPRADGTKGKISATVKGTLLAAWYISTTTARLYATKRKRTKKRGQPADP